MGWPVWVTYGAHCPSHVGGGGGGPRAWAIWAHIEQVGSPCGTHFGPIWTCLLGFVLCYVAIHSSKVILTFQKASSCPVEGCGSYKTRMSTVRIHKHLRSTSVICRSKTRLSNLSGENIVFYLLFFYRSEINMRRSAHTSLSLAK